MEILKLFFWRREILSIRSEEGTLGRWEEMDEQIISTYLGDLCIAVFG